MILTIDIGNSNTVLVAYDENDKIVFESRFETYKTNIKESYLANLVKQEFNFSAIVVACVVPVLQEEILEVIEDYYGVKPILVNGKTIKNFIIKLDNPSDIGADFIATSVGAVSKSMAPVIVADVGSATKLTLTNKLGEFEGGVILPGLGSSLKSLVSLIPHLPEVNLSIPDKIVGKNTIHAIQSGMLYGIIAQINELANMIEEEHGEACARILTGGYATLFNQMLPKFEYEEHLVNDGLYQIYLKKMV